MIELSILRSTSTCAACVVLLFFAFDAHAYIGPGAGLTAIGSLFALVAAVVVGIFGFIWFPIRRLLRRKTNSAQAQSSDEQNRADQKVSAQEENPKEQESTL